MNNIKKLAMGILVAVLAVGFSAFKGESKRVSATYYQTSSNLYEKLISPTGDCTTEEENPCSIFYAVDPEAAPFSYEERPENGVPSEETQLFVVTP